MPMPKLPSEERRRRINEGHRRWRTANPEKHAAIQWRAQLKRKYGITPEDYDHMLSEQGGTCKLCSTPPDPTHPRKKTLHVDHCHTTGKIRGLLCIACNRMLGQVENNRARFLAMIDYLDENAP